MTKKELLEWAQQKQEQLAKWKDLGYDLEDIYDIENIYIEFEKLIKELE